MTPGPPLSLPSQFTEEKFGQAEKTELDAHFENLLARADSTKNWTERILRQTEVLLQPNPSEWVRADAGLWVWGSKAHSEWRESQACAQELKPELKYTWEGTRKLHMSAWARSQRWERA